MKTFWIVGLELPRARPRRSPRHAGWPTTRNTVMATSRPISSRQTQSGMLPQIGIS